MKAQSHSLKFKAIAAATLGAGMVLAPISAASAAESADITIKTETVQAGLGVAHMIKEINYKGYASYVAPSIAISARAEVAFTGATLLSTSRSGSQTTEVNYRWYVPSTYQQTCIDATLSAYFTRSGGAVVGRHDSKGECGYAG